MIEGRRWSVPGDRARYLPNGVIEVLGRDSTTINSGGEKIFAEEVENALKLHPAVYDAVVCGRPSDRWGQEVVAIVRLRDHTTATEQDLLAECRKHIARYKLPKAVLFEEEIVRSPSGKPDYRWARARAAGELRAVPRDARPTRGDPLNIGLSFRNRVVHRQSNAEGRSKRADITRFRDFRLT